MRLEKNLLTGTLHSPSILSMQNLETLSLSDNDISGIIPGHALGSLPALEYLYLDGNQLVGPLPANLAQIGKAHLLELWVQSNALSGTVPASYKRFDKLHNFFIDGNKLTGALSPDVCGPEINSDFFSDVPSESERNYCEYIACPSGSVGAEGVYPCEKCVGGDVATIQNPYIGQRGDCVYLTQRDVLKVFYEATSMNGTWTGVNDWNEDNKYLCDLTGVACDAHNNVVKISLKNRNLAGSIPYEVGIGLPFLEVLDLSDNDLTGFLPSDLRYTALTQLDVSGNNIRGIVPPLLCMDAELNKNEANNVFYCDRIACPAGTYNAFGRHGNNGEVCLPCYDGSPYIGQKTCTQRIDNSQSKSTWEKGVEAVRESTDHIAVHWQVALGIVGIAWLIATSVCCFVRCGRHKMAQQKKYRKMQGGDEESDSDSSDEDDIEDYMMSDNESDDNDDRPNKRRKSTGHLSITAGDDYLGDDIIAPPPILTDTSSFKSTPNLLTGHPPYKDSAHDFYPAKTRRGSASSRNSVGSTGSSNMPNGHPPYKDSARGFYPAKVRRGSSSSMHSVGSRGNMGNSSAPNKGLRRNGKSDLDLAQKSPGRPKDKKGTMMVATMIERTRSASAERAQKLFGKKSQPEEVSYDDSYYSGNFQKQSSGNLHLLETLAGPVERVGSKDGDIVSTTATEATAKVANSNRMKEQLLDVPRIGW